MARPRRADRLLFAQNKANLNGVVTNANSVNTKSYISNGSFGTQRNEPNRNQFPENIK